MLSEKRLCMMKLITQNKPADIQATKKSAWTADITTFQDRQTDVEDKSSSVNHFISWWLAGQGCSCQSSFTKAEWKIFWRPKTPFILNNGAIVQQQIMNIITFKQLGVCDLGGLWNSIKRSRNRLRFCAGESLYISLLLCFQYEAMLLAWPCVTYISLITVHLKWLHFGWSIFMGSGIVSRKAETWTLFATPLPLTAVF